jgi:hypothetical protein
MRLLPKLLLHVIIALPAAAAVASVDGAGFSGDEVEAAVRVEASREDLASAAQACGEQFPNKAATMRGAEYFWEQNHFSVMRGADIVREAVHVTVGGNGPRALEGYRKQLAELAKDGSKHAQGRCNTLLATFMHMPGTPPLIAPEISQRLEAVYARVPHPVNEIRNHDFVVGCQINRWNRGDHDIAAMMQTCECTAKVVAEMADAPDQSEYKVFQRATAASAVQRSEISEATKAKLAACARLSRASQ